jgi:hypothetical protein
VRTLELGKDRRARVWLGELPDAACPTVRTLTHTIAAGRESQNFVELAAIEVFVPLGPRSMYGLLGGQMKPNAASNNLRISVSVSAANERLLADSLAMRGDVVRVGLPAEYAQAVLAGVNLAKGELNALNAGRLSINRAAHGAIASCEAVYKHLAAILVKLFNAVSLEPSDDELVKLFPPTFS